MQATKKIRKSGSKGTRELKRTADKVKQRLDERTDVKDNTSAKEEKNGTASPLCVVFCDSTNQELDIEYAESIIREFRNQMGWKVVEGTPIWNHLRDFSKGYSRKRRNPVEVVMIFRIASGLQ